MLLIALLLAAAPAQDVGVVNLTDVAQVRDMCAALRDGPGGKWYRLEVPSKGFALGRYRARDKQLELDGDWPVRAVGDTLSVDLQGIDEVAFNATADQVAQWTEAKKAGDLRLVVVFSPTGDRCAGSPFAQSWRVAGEARSWELVDEKGTVVARADADGQPLGGVPHVVKVDKVRLDSDSEDAVNGSRLSQAQGALEKCAANAQHTGVLLLSFNVQGGRVRDPQVIMDSVRDEKIAACMASAVSGQQVGGTGHGTASISLQ